MHEVPTMSHVPSESEVLLVDAERALEAGEWSTARSSFEAALELEETPEALLGLGNALWWLDEAEASLRYRERAYAAFRRRPDPFHAAATALQLAAHYGGNLGDVPAARGWGARAGRLVEEFELAPLEGWVLLGRAAGASSGGNPRVGEGFARQALEIARRVGDTDLELCALSQLGGALVLMGRVEEGASLLDEAMAGALGGEGGPETVVHASCVTIVCCSRAAELKRAAQWIRAAGEFNRRYGSPHLDAVCRTAYGAVLLATGRWAEAETELQSALQKMSKTAEPLVRAEALGEARRAAPRAGTSRGGGAAARWHRGSCRDHVRDRGAPPGPGRAGAGRVDPAPPPSQRGRRVPWSRRCCWSC